MLVTLLRYKENRQDTAPIGLWREGGALIKYIIYKVIYINIIY